MNSNVPKQPANDFAHLPDRLIAAWQSFADWITVHSGDIVLALIIGTAIFGAMLVVRHILKKLFAGLDDKLGLGFGQVLSKTVGRTSRIFMALAAARLVVGNANPPPSLYRLIAVLFVIAAAYQVAIWAREIILGVIERRTGEAEDATNSIGNAMTIIRLLVTAILFAIATVVVLDNLGVNVTGLVAGLGIGGIAIGLAAQGIFSDLFSALSILFDKPFKRGDVITFDTTTGTVEQIGLKSTRLRSLSGEEKIISNTKLLEKEIGNNTARDYRRAKFILALVQHTKPELVARVPDILREIVEKAGGTLVRAGFTAFSPSSLDVELDFDAPQDFEEFFAIRHKVGLGILERFAKEGVEFAYPTQTTYTAAPDGTLIMPFAGAPAEPPKRTPKHAPKHTAK